MIQRAKLVELVLRPRDLPMMLAVQWRGHDSHCQRTVAARVSSFGVSTHVADSTVTDLLT